MIEVARLHDGHYRPEDLLTSDGGAHRNVGEDGRLDEPAVALGLLAAQHELAFALAGLDVTEDLVELPFVDDGRHVWVLVGGAHGQLLRALLELGHELVVNVLYDDRAAHGRALLALEA